MDYPKSVPGVGLVDGRFVNEDPATGQLGSIIPAEWGNALMSELFSVMAKRGVMPDETKFNQLAEVIFTLATVNAAGMVQLASATETAAGENNDKAITPALLKQEIGKIPAPTEPPGDATTSAKGLVQLATETETAAGLDGTKAVTPVALKKETDKKLGRVGALPILESTGNIELQLNSVGLVSVIRGFLDGVSSWQVGMSDASGDLVIFSAKHNTTLRLSSDRLTANKPLYVGANQVLTAAVAFGIGQTWQNVTASRASGVVYTNSLAKPIAVSVFGELDVRMEVSVDGTNWVLVGRNSKGTVDATIFAIVPPGHRYRLTAGYIYNWAELR